MKISTAKKPTKEPQKAKVDMISARVVVAHLDDLDGLNCALNELACLVAGDNQLAIPALLSLLRDHYSELSKSFTQSVKEALNGVPSVH